MKVLPKSIIAISVVSVLALGLTGCSQTEPKNELKPSSTKSATPTEAPKVSMKDFVPQTDANGKPVIITDQYGSYAPITINPQDESLILDKTLYDEKTLASGWTDADVLSAQQWIVKFVVEQGIDSIAVDTPDGWAKWKAEEASKYLAPEWMTMVTTAENVAEGSDRGALIFNNPNNSQPVFVRNNGPREATGTVTLTKVSSMVVGNASTPALIFDVSVTTSYKATDKELLALYVKNNPTVSEEDILKIHPEMEDGKDNVLPEVTSVFEYGVQKVGDTWGIMGFQNSWTTAQE